MRALRQMPRKTAVLFAIFTAAGSLPLNMFSHKERGALKSEEPQCFALTDGQRFPVAHFKTTKGDFEVQLRPDLGPASVKHLTEMIDAGYFANISFFRVNEAITQFGADENNARPRFKAMRQWPDEMKDKNPCGDMRWALGTFAMLGGNQMLIVINPNDHMGKNKLDAPAGYVTKGMDVVAKLHAYNDQIDNPSGGAGPDQGKLQDDGGLAYLKKNFPDLDYINSAEVIQPEKGGATMKLHRQKSDMRI
jgi:cyclophilin family peptidyl-prolyl cis-trans isomerase